MKKIILFFFSLLCFPWFLTSQEAVNQFDSTGERHGYWKKTYPGTTQLQYEGTFEHGKEVGVFKTYCQECGSQASVIRTFNKDGSVWVQYFTKKGKLVSEGAMIDKDREGEWLYYHEKSTQIMSSETYKNGKLDGKQKTFYPDGKITEEITYVNDIKEGENLYYAPNGIIIKKLQYRNNELQGPAYYYDSSGNAVIEGYYKEGKKHGLWKYFKNGKIELEETYPKPLEKQ